MEARSPRVSARVGVNERVSREKVQRDTGGGARTSGGDRVPQLVNEGENSDRSGQPISHGLAVHHHDQQHEQDESGSYLYGKPEDAHGTMLRDVRSPVEG